MVDNYKNMDNTILKMQFLAWIIFLIPSFIFIYGSYGLYKSMILLGQGIYFIPFLGPLFGIVSAFFFGRYFLERAKRKILQTRLNRGQNRITYLESIVAEQKVQLESRSGESTP